MAWKPMEPAERASIEAQVILKAAVELAVAEIGNEPDGVAVTMAIENARALARELPNLKDSLVLVGAEVAIAPEAPAYVPQAAVDAAMVAAACRLSGSPLESPDYALLGEFEHQLSKHAPRKVKKQIVDVCKRIQAEGVTTEDWADSARSSLDRMATIAAGDVSWVLAFDGERGRLEDSHEMNARAKRLLSFVLSPEYLSIREKLGMGIR